MTFATPPGVIGKRMKARGSHRDLISSSQLPCIPFLNCTLSMPVNILVKMSIGLEPWNGLSLAMSSNIRMPGKHISYNWQESLRYIQIA